MHASHGAVKIDFQEQLKTLVIAGSMSETTPYLQVEEAIANAVARLNGQERLTIDLGGVATFNSIGIRKFSEILSAYAASVALSRIPVLLVGALNVQLNTFDPALEIKSFQAPFVDANGRDVEVTLDIGKDIPILDDYDDYELPDLGPKTRGLTPDFYPEDYFPFLSYRKDV